MGIGLIADSCCDCTPQMKKILGIEHAALKINIPGFGQYIDDGTLDTKKLVKEMKECNEASGSACPSPEDYASLMRKYDESFVITLSSKLSGSYNAAERGRDLVLEDYPDKKIYIVDSKTAASGELKIAMAIKTWIDKGLSFEEIKQNVDEFVANLKTIFVLEDLGNLVKNGRISKAAGLLGGMLGLRPIMSENGEGEIICLEKVRGTEKAMKRLVEVVGEKLDGKKDITMIICHCNCIERAQQLKKDIVERYKEFKDVILVPTGGLSTVYANNGGVILSF